MNINEIYEAFLSYSRVMKLNMPLTNLDISNFENKNNILLPTSFSKLLMFFDGGEIFVPGTQIYGIKNEPSIKSVNRAEYRNNFHIPKQYMIIAKLNFGDLICINLNSPYDIIQWDHETDEQYCTWSSIEEWLDESIATYKSFEDGVK